MTHPTHRPPALPVPVMLARGTALGGWTGTALATLIALVQGHSVLLFLQDLALLCVPLMGLGALVSLLIATSRFDTSAPNSAELAHQMIPADLSEDDLQSLLERLRTET